MWAPLELDSRVVVEDPRGTAAGRVLAREAAARGDQQVALERGPGGHQVVVFATVAAGEHHSACSREAGALVQLQGGGDVIRTGEQSGRQHAAVLHRLT